MNSRSLLMLFARISPRTMLVLILGLSAGVTWVVTSELGNRKAEQELIATASAPVKQKTTILICSRNLDEGTIIAPEDIVTRVVEAERAPIDALTTADAAVGRTVKFPIAAGTLISQRDLALMEVTKGFQSKLRAGERAVTFAVDNSTGVAGFVSPDSHVDVMVQVGAGADSKTRAILSDVRVVASGTTYQKLPGQSEAQPASTVTVAVQPFDAAKLINAMAAGKIYLTLRSDVDHTPIAVSDFNSLFRAQRPTPETAIASVPAPLPPPPPVLHIDQPEEPQNPIHEIEQYAGANRDVKPVKEL